MTRLEQVLWLGAAMGATLGLMACGADERAAPEALIQTAQGPVQGVSIEDEGHYTFRGLPFAAAPTDDLRWAAPAPAPTWTETRAATEFGNRCMQPASVEDGFFKRLIEGHGLSGWKNFLITRAVAAQDPAPMSEDCLYLNVRTKNLNSDSPQPVMVWIHGGGHQFGSSDFSYYQAGGLVENDVVLVTINYRLGVFGYMAHPALSADDPNGVSGNYGALDQMAALKWVQDNIRAYGGDPENVTIFGESAGSWSVTEMMASPLAEGLFHKAIGQSGASTYHLGQMEGDGLGWPSGYATGERVENALGLTGASAADLRNVPAEEIMSKLPEKSDEAFHHIRDGYVFPKNVGIAFRDGDINAVPIMMGYNADEGSLFFPTDPEPSVWLEGFPHEGSTEEKQSFLSAAFPTQASKLMDLYDLGTDSKTGGEDMMGDEIFGVNVRYAARQVEALGKPAYLYHFSRIPPSKKQTLGAFHAAEIPFVFDSHETILGLTPEDKQLTELMMDSWTNFAKTGDPNGPTLSGWAKHSGQNWMHFSANTGRPVAATETGVRKAKLDALEEGLLTKLEALSPASTKGELSPASGGAP